METLDPTAAGASAAALALDLARLYPDLDAAFLAEAPDAFEPVRVAGGDVLVRRGDPTDALYIVLAGRFVATGVDAHGAPLRLGEIGRGELIGEMTVLSGGPRTATVVALRDARLVRIGNAAFVRFMQRHPSVMRRFVEVLVRRLTPVGEARGRVATVALVAGPGMSGVHDFAHRLVAALGARVRRIDAAIAREHCGDLAPAAQDGRLGAWLAAEEDAHALLVFETDPQPGPWTDAALRHADRVLIVARADAPEVKPIGTEQGLAGTTLRGCELVLLGTAGRPPRDTARWLAGRTLLRHHHAADDDPAALDRLARHLLGRSVALALGGGGARCFAEIGVLRALEDARVPVDVIAGTSMGAVIGGLAARGADARAVQGALRDALALRPFSGLAWPRHALLSERRLARFVQRLFDDARIEDTPRRFVPVCCNLTDGVLALPEAGSLARWVQASNAVPGLLPPVIEGGKLHVDGALLDNVPVDVAAARTAGVVIGVNVSRGDGLSADAAGRLPRLDRVLVRSMLLASGNHTRSARERAALFLEPPLEGIDVNDWTRIDAIVEAGYAHAAAALERWSPPA
jgi:NTE family protein